MNQIANPLNQGELKFKSGSFRTQGPIAPPTTSRKIAVSFIIPALNEEKWIPVCLKSIAQLVEGAGDVKSEVIVVDNRSTDRTVELAKSGGAQIVSCDPGRASRARNIGAAKATGQWLIFVDADCELSDSWLTTVQRYFQDPNVVAMGGLAVPPTDSGNWLWRTLRELTDHSDSSERAVRWLPTAGLAIRKSEFDKIGGFDESLVTCEDCDFGYRLSDSLVEQNRVLLELPNATLLHHGESSTLMELFRREAWRTGDNLKLAMHRKGDFRNWMSLLVPLLFGAILFISTVVLLATLLTGSVQTSSLQWTTASLIGLSFSLAMPAGIVLIKRRHGRSVFRFLRQWLVMTTFLTGRCLGLFHRFGRLTR